MLNRQRLSAILEGLNNDLIFYKRISIGLNGPDIDEEAEHPPLPPEFGEEGQYKKPWWDEFEHVEQPHGHPHQEHLHSIEGPAPEHDDVEEAHSQKGQVVQEKQLVVFDPAHH